MTPRRPGVVVASPQDRLRPAGILTYPLAAIGTGLTGHRDPWTALVSIHPVGLAVAACLPSSLGARFILRLGAQAMTSWWLGRRCRAAGSSQGAVAGVKTRSG